MEGYDSDVAADFKPLSPYTPPQAAGAPSRRPFLGRRLRAGRRASGEGRPAPSELPPLGALSSSTALMALDELVQKRRFEAIRPWLRGLEPPSAASGLPAATERAPLNTLELEWVHGARTHDVRGALHVTAAGEFVYPTAALVVLYKPASSKPDGGCVNCGQQRFYRKHTGAVLCTAVHPEGAIVASGALGSDAAVHIWESTTLAPLSILRSVHSGGVAAIAFSGGDGQLLASLDLAQSPLLALWDWRRGELLASARAGRSRVLGLAFNPVTGLCLWRGHAAGQPTGRSQVARGSLGRAVARRNSLGGAYTCVAFSTDGESTLCGTADGCVPTWAHTRSGTYPVVASRRSSRSTAPRRHPRCGQGWRLLWWPGLVLAPGFGLDA